MFVNYILSYFQNIFSGLYKKSLILKNIDWLIFVSICLVIISSAFASSDSIGYFAIFGMMMTGLKLLTKPKAFFSMNLAEKFLLIYFMFVIVSVAGSTYLYLSIKGFSKSLVYIGFYITCIEYFKSHRNNIKYVLLLIAVMAVDQSLIALKQNLISVDEISGWQDVSHLNPEDIMTRVYGSLKPYNPNLFGGYMLSVVPSTIILFILPFINKHFKTSILGFTCFIISLVAVLLTGCRGAYMGLFVELVFLVIFTYRHLKPLYRKVFLIVTGFMSFCCCLIILSISSLRTRIFSIFAMRNDSSNSFRFNVYHSCINMFKDNWLLGIGVGNQNFREIYGLYMKTGFDALSAYNIYLEIAVESGIFALISFLIFVFINVKRALYYVFNKKRLNTVYVAVALVSIFGMLMHGFVDTVFFRPQIQFIFWMMIAIIRVLTTGKLRSIKYAKVGN